MCMPDPMAWPIGPKFTPGYRMVSRWDRRSMCIPNPMAWPIGPGFILGYRIGRFGSMIRYPENNLTPCRNRSLKS